VSSDIQSLIFGGLGFLPFGTAMICELPADPGRARAWLQAIRRDIAFNDGRRLAQDAVITLSLSWRGLTRLGLPEYAGPTFPFAFVEGMTKDYRQRILGDLGKDSPEGWRWGREQPDAAILIYGRSDTAVDALKVRFLAECTTAGMPPPFEVPLRTITEDKTEPFGFTDGVSQPVIRGTYKSLRNADPIHIVEPGEMVLGYPDNRGYIPRRRRCWRIRTRATSFLCWARRTIFPVRLPTRRATLASMAVSLSFASSSRTSMAFRTIARRRHPGSKIGFRRPMTSMRSISPPSWSAAGETDRRWCANPTSPRPSIGRSYRHGRPTKRCFPPISASSSSSSRPRWIR
jgi:hypothetical protein